MKRVTKALLAVLALAGAAIAVSAPANAAGVYFGYGSGPYYGGYYSSSPYSGYDPYYGYGDPYYDQYADPYACDYYDPPWGYPPDYCLYQTWNDPVYYGGLWYSGPIYYRSYLGANWFWLNGGWRRDEWRGSRPGRIDWDRNMRWSGPVRHRDFAGRDNWNGANGNGFGNRGGFDRGDRNGAGAMAGTAGPRRVAQHGLAGDFDVAGEIASFITKSKEASN